jgi:ComF family protein
MSSLLSRLLPVLGRASLTGLANLVGPRGCAACDEAVVRSVFCPACAASIVRAPPAERDEPLAFALFGGAVAVALRRFKYEGRPDLAGPLGQLLRRVAAERAHEPGLVVPVPLHPARLAERGYNQAALLARSIASAAALPLDASALVRVRNTAQQARLARGSRLTNVVGAFVVPRPRRVAGRAVLLIDDVATTGSTLAACEAALRSAGATRVTSMVLARADAATALGDWRKAA